MKLWSEIKGFFISFKRLFVNLDDLSIKNIELREDNLKLKEEIKNFKEKENIKNELIRIGNSYCREKKNGEKSGPYCMKCMDYEDKLLFLYKSSPDGERWHCYTCSFAIRFSVTEIVELKKYTGSLL